MLVSDYVTNTINSRPLKYGTKQSYIKGIKSLGIWDLDTSELSSALVFEKTDQMRSHNVKKNIYIMLRSIFKDLGLFSDLPILSGISKTYNLPSQQELHDIIERSKYRRILYLCMYAGLRVGEACAVVPSQLEGNYLIVDRAFSQDGKHLGSPKTFGKVLIPAWLADEVRSMQIEDQWKIGMSTQLVSWACVSLSKKGSKVHINPHMLRHWFATDMIRRGVNPETVRRQMRHSNINTTMRIYVQINSTDLEESVPLTPSERNNAVSQTIPFKLKLVK
ncbi:XerC Integrase [Candidatus Nanopelagicaceae bacterium]